MDWEDALPELTSALTARATVLLRTQSAMAGRPQPADLAQATLLKLREANAAERFAGASFERIRMFAFRVLQNHFIDTCHRKRTELLLPEAEETSSPALQSLEERGPEQALLAVEELGQRRKALRTALAELSDDERDFLAAVLREGTAPAAQRALGWPPGSASNACQRRNAILAKVKRAVERMANRPSGRGEG